MALGALSSNPESRLRIVPVGLSYFAPHRFRSRAVVEFGSPIEIPNDFVADFERGGEDKRKAIAATMDLIVHGLQAVTVRTPDHDTLMLIQAVRRLYRPPGQQLSLGAVVELNKRFVAGYERYKDEPQVKQLTEDVRSYNRELRHLGLKDHQVDQVKRPLWRSLALLIYRTGLVTTWGTFALPGLILNAPIFIAAKIISIRKAKEALAASTVKLAGRDVLATWKVLVALAAAPALYSVYAVGAVILAFKLDLALKYKLLAPTATFVGVPMTSYAALNFGEVGLDVYKSLRPLFLSVLPGSERQLEKLRAERLRLQDEIHAVVDKLGPTVFDDFQSQRIVPGAAIAQAARPVPRRRRTYGSADKTNFLTHPLNWLDEKVFGWGQSQKDQERDQEVNGYLSEGPSAFPSGYATDAEEADYDQGKHPTRNKPAACCKVADVFCPFLATCSHHDPRQRQAWPGRAGEPDAPQACPGPVPAGPDPGQRALRAEHGKGQVSGMCLVVWMESCCQGGGEMVVGGVISQCSVQLCVALMISGLNSK